MDIPSVGKACALDASADILIGALLVHNVT